MTYHFRTDVDDHFQSTLTEFTNFTIKEGSQKFESIYSDLSKKLSIHKYDLILQLLIIGVLWREYGNKRFSLGSYFKPLFKALQITERNSLLLKPTASIIHDWLTGLLLNNDANAQNSISKQNYLHFLKWVECTNEYAEELEYIAPITEYWKSINSFEFIFQFNDVLKFSEWFYRGGRFYLGNYTIDIPVFIKKFKSQYRYKKNYFFVTRSESVYFLNLVGTELLNKKQKNQSYSKKNKVLLLPTNIDGATNCNPIQRKELLYCSQCNKECSIKKLSEKLKLNDKLEIVITPKKSNKDQIISKLLLEENIEVINVCCITNLLKNSLRMQHKKTPPRCVFIYDIGCKNAWIKELFPTLINEELLTPLIDHHMHHVRQSIFSR